MSDNSENFDVLIVGAGLSGIGAAHRVMTECPGKTFAVLEGRSDMGGTWDLFRYPGVRSDSDMYTLGFAFRPWQKADESIAEGGSILRYLHDSARELGIDSHIRYNHRVVTASWSSTDACWRVVSEVPDRAPVEHRAKFLYLCTGYYSYDEPYQPEFAGRDRFAGDFVHPQFWPEDLDWEGKQVVVIGSGATGVTLVPAMADQAAHVTMLQRSPTYMVALTAADPIARFFEDHFPAAIASKLSRWKNILLSVIFYQLCRRQPTAAKELLLKGVEKLLPGEELDPHFVPRYEPWDQRLCLVADGDLFRVIREGKASVVTDRIATLTESGIELETGRHLAADVIVSATGLSLLAWGGIEVDLDGAPIAPRDTLIYRGFMLGDVPNFAFALGYTNASFTLRSDLSSRGVCRLLNFMDSHGFDVATPSPEGVVALRKAAIDLTSGYVTRGIDRMPKQGSAPPWTVRQNYLLDFLTMTFGRVSRSIRFSRSSAAVPDGARNNGRRGWPAIAVLRVRAAAAARKASQAAA